VVDLRTLEAAVWEDDSADGAFRREPVPADLVDTAREARAALVEACGESDDEVMAAFVEGREPAAEDLTRALRRMALSGAGVPVLCGAAFRNKGVQPLLDAVVDLLPSPIDVPPIRGVRPDRSRDEVREADPEAPFAALAFKLAADAFAGQIVYVRLYSGRIRVGQTVFNAGKGKRERLAKLLRMHANKREEVREASAGEIVAIVGLRFTTTGDTLCDEKHPVLLDAIPFPEPVISLAVEPKAKDDEERLPAALAKLEVEDPSLQVRVDPETAQTLLWGMGELHLEVVLERLRREFHVQVNTGRPQVAYKETVGAVHDCEGRFVRQAGGKGQYGHVRLRLAPSGTGGGNRFLSEAPVEEVPLAFVPAVERGVRDALTSGPLAGYPMVDVTATLLGGSWNESDSTEGAFQAAGHIAFREGADKASPVLLEPVMAVEVVTPEASLGDVLGDLQSRRGRVIGMRNRGDLRVVDAHVPLSGMFGYATDIRSRSQGRATYTMQFSRYEAVPPAVSKGVVAQVRGGW
jgi:elongation factor G